MASYDILNGRIEIEAYRRADKSSRKTGERWRKDLQREVGRLELCQFRKWSEEPT